MPAGRPKGAKNKVQKEKDNRSSLIFRVDYDVEEHLRKQRLMSKYINELIRKDMINERLKKEEETMKRMNTYNFVEKGCVFYHAIAESEEQAIELAQGAGYDISGMGIELERMNVRDELGKPYSPRIEESLVD